MENLENKHENVPSRITYSSLFWLFMFGSVIGFILEGIWCILKGQGWENHSATVWGPFCIVYGIGAVALYLVATFIKNRSLPIQLIVCGVIGSAVEYFSSLFQELCFGSTSWNYSKQFMNIGGRVSLKMTLIWGMLGIFFIKWLYPTIYRILGKMDSKAWDISCILLTVFMVINLSLTSLAVIRWRERLESVPASGAVDEFLDEYYDNEEMSEIFSNMVFST